MESALRLSPHYYNTDEEVDRAVAAIADSCTPDLQGYRRIRQTTPTSSQYQSVPSQMVRPWDSGSLSAS